MARDAAATERFLFVVTAHVPDQRNCNLLTRTVDSIRRHHPTALTLVFDNASPAGNVEAALAAFDAQARSAVLVSRQEASQLQLGSWHAASVLLHARHADPATRERLRSARRVVTLQHSTALTRSLPPTTWPGCGASVLTETYKSTFYWNKRFENRKGSALWFASRAAEQMGIVCTRPCLNTSTGVPNWIVGHNWRVVPHAALDFTRDGWEAMSSALWGRASRHREAGGSGSIGDGRHTGSPAVSAMLHALDSGKISRKECNGALERFVGILRSWLNGFNESLQRKHCSHFSRINGSLLKKTHGFTFGEAVGADADDWASSPRASSCTPAAAGRFASSLTGPGQGTDKLLGEHVPNCVAACRPACRPACTARASRVQ